MHLDHSATVPSWKLGSDPYFLLVSACLVGIKVVGLSFAGVFGKGGIFWCIVVSHFLSALEETLLFFNSLFMYMYLNFSLRICY